MATENLVKELKKHLNELAEYRDKELIRRPNEWGVINFEDAEKDIRLVLDVAKDLLNLPLEYLTDKAAQSIIQKIPQVTEYLRSIDKFTLVGDPTGNRNSLSQNFHTSAENFHAISSPHIPYLAYRRGDISENIAQLNDAVRDAKTVLGQTESWIAEEKDKVEGIVQAAQDAAAAVGVATFTQEFDSEASKLNFESNTWLGVIIALLLTTINTVVFFDNLLTIPAAPDEWDLLHYFFSKAAVIVLLFSATVWCVRIYRAKVHQSTVNRHRALSLKTFQAFVKSTDDPIVRDAVLMAATKSVFGTVPTGLVEQPGGEDNGVNFVEFGKSSGRIVGASAEGVQ